MVPTRFRTGQTFLLRSEAPLPGHLAAMHQLMLSGHRDQTALEGVEGQAAMELPVAQAVLGASQAAVAAVVGQF